VNRFAPKRLTENLAIRLVTLFAAFLSAAASAQIDDAAAESLMKKSGMTRQLEGASAQVAAGLAQALAQGEPKPPAEVVERMMQAATKSMSAARLARDMRGELAKSIRASDLPVLNKWFDGPLGKRITKIEEDLSHSDLSKVLADGTALWETAPPARRQAIDSFIAAAKLNEALANMTINVSSAIAFGALSATPGPGGRSFADVRGIITGQRDEIVKSMVTINRAMAVAGYASVSNADLAAYSRFMRSAAGARYMDTTIDALDKVLLRAATDIGQAMADGAASSKS